MATFAYKAVDVQGRESAGKLTAASRNAAMDEILRRDLQPVLVEEEKQSAGATVFRSRKVSASAAESFIRELANLLAAGVPLGRSLHILSREASRPAQRDQWGEIQRSVSEGISLADSMAQFPRSFRAVDVAMVRAGETGGFLDVVLTQVADFRSQERDLVGRVKAAMVYPAVLAVLASLVLVFLLTFFIPRFSGIFADFGGALPWLTRAIVSASHLAMSYGPFILVAVILGVVGLRRAMTTDAGRRFMERVFLAVPLVGQVTGRFALVRFCRMLGTLLGAGVPLVAALRVAKEAIGIQALSDTVAQAVEEVQRGSSLSRSLAASPKLFPGSVSEMVAVAEESGRLDKELVRLADVYEKDLDRRLRVLVALAEPALLFVMAALVGTIVIGMLLPVFTLQDLVR